MDLEFKRCDKCAAMPVGSDWCDSCMHNIDVIIELKKERILPGTKKAFRSKIITRQAIAEGWTQYITNLVKEIQLQTKANMRKNKQITYLRKCNRNFHEKTTHQHRELMAIRGFLLELIKGDWSEVKAERIGRAERLLMTNYKVKPDDG